MVKKNKPSAYLYTGSFQNVFHVVRFAQTNVFVISAVLNVPVKCSMVHRFLVFVAQNENVSPIRKSPMPQVMSNATTTFLDLS